MTERGEIIQGYVNDMLAAIDSLEKWMDRLDPSQAKAIAACAEGMARNPGAINAIRGALILGLAFIAFEITLIQRFSLVLGYPTYSLTVTNTANGCTKTASVTVTIRSGS